MKQKKILVTGGVGFLGTYLCNYLAQAGNQVISFDKLTGENKVKNISFVKGDILSQKSLKKLFIEYGPFDSIYHLAAHLPNKSVTKQQMYETNVKGTRQLIEAAIHAKVKSFIFTSSNTVYGVPITNPVLENTKVSPIEHYGESKVKAEDVLKQYASQISIKIFRCPVISGKGRLGLQGLLYEFISENKNIYLLGNGINKYQFIDAEDLCVALEKASHKKGFSIYNIGADNIVSLRYIYESVIRYAQSSSKIIALPKKPAEYMLAILNALHISPIGVYQYTMLGLSLYADTSKIKKELLWNPKKTNLDIFIENYQWYIENKNLIQTFKIGKNSANKSIPQLKFLKFIKYFS